MSVQTLAIQAARTLIRGPRGRRINAAYAGHYKRARELYARAHGDGATAYARTPYPLLVVPPDMTGEGLQSTFLQQTRRLAIAADHAFALSERCFFLPPLKRLDGTPRTSDLPEVRARQILTAQLRSHADLDALDDVALAVVDLAQRSIYRAYAIVDKVYVYRNLVSQAEPIVSWRWHYDNHPREIIKAMIYLTDVGPRHAPFEYLRHRESGDPAAVDPLPTARDSRVTEAQLARFRAAGYDPFPVIAPAGTIIFFQDNLIHRATVAVDGPRDVAVLQLRPADFCPDAPINARWTGSFHHEDVNPDPNDYRTIAKARMHSA